MGNTRKDNVKVRITIRAYEDTIKKIKENGSTLQKEWDEFVEKRYKGVEKCGEIVKRCQKD